MSLKDYLSIQDEVEKIELTENKVMEILPHAESYISFWREYPDLFVDFLKGPNSNFNLYFYQRVMLRANCRYKYTFMSFPRA